MNNNIQALANGDFNVLPIGAVIAAPHYKITYYDFVLGMGRTRHHSTLNDALQFIELRAGRPHLYNNFTLEVLQ